MRLLAGPLALLAGQAARAAAQAVYLSPGGSQYIKYAGAVRATTTLPAGCCGGAACSPAGETVGPYKASALYVGVNPTWDTNPFFFQLWHTASDGGFLTEDRVYNLDFASTVMACWKDGQPCGFIETDPEYEVERKLDLTSAKVARMSVGEDGETEYVVQGDQDSYVGDEADSGEGTRVDVDEACSGGDQSVDWKEFEWSASTPFTYKLSFSNTTASISIATTVNGSTMTLEFTGDRSAGSDHIELLTSDRNMPKWQYTNGIPIIFKHSGDIWYTVTPEKPTATKNNSPSSTSPASGPGTTTANSQETSTSTGSKGGSSPTESSQPSSKPNDDNGASSMVGQLGTLLVASALSLFAGMLL